MKYDRNNEKDKKDRNYRKIEAMYRRGYDNQEIIKQCPDMESYEVLNIIQDIFGRDMMRAEKSEI